MKQYIVDLNTKFYCLQPGDGTWYGFFIARTGKIGYWEDEKSGDTGIADVGSVVRGLEPGFVLVGINMPGHQGIYPTSKRALKDLRLHHVQYMSGHMGGLYPYAVAAVLLVVGVLVEDPNDLIGAAKAMLRAPEILAQQ